MVYEIIPHIYKWILYNPLSETTRFFSIALLVGLEEMNSGWLDYKKQQIVCIVVVGLGKKKGLDLIFPCHVGVPFLPTPKTMPRTFLTDFWLINKFLILRYAVIIPNLYNSGSTLRHNLEGYILHLNVLHLNKLVKGANGAQFLRPFLRWRRIGAPDHVLQRIDGLAHGGNVLR